MERSRVKGLVSRGVACILLSGALVVGHAPLSHAGHAGDGGCWSEEPPGPSEPVDYRGPGGAFIVGAGAAGTFVAVDGDLSGVEVYGRLGSFEILGSKHWFSVKADRSPGDEEQFLDVCSKPHG